MTYAELSRPGELLYSVSFYDDDSSPAVELSIYEGDVVRISRRDARYYWRGILTPGAPRRPLQCGADAI